MKVFAAVIACDCSPLIGDTPMRVARWLWWRRWVSWYRGGGLGEGASRRRYWRTKLHRRCYRA
jgi:hypothetical protein